MPLIAWRPMPKTEDRASKPGYRAGAFDRARHRVLMVLRWRDKALRDADKKARRLPVDWHDWMMCPAEKGYGSRWCTCDQRIDNSPRGQRDRERMLRATLDRELRLSMKERSSPAKVSLDPVVASWACPIEVNSIDTHTPPTSMPPHDDPASSSGADHPAARSLAPGQVGFGSRLSIEGGTARLVRQPARQLTVRGPAAKEPPGGHAGRHDRQRERLAKGRRPGFASWIARLRRYVSALRSNASEAG